ncbi:MAG: peptidase M14, partial [Calditrichaeota bacterium]|nr:peptidase M14 [Calditrichota bacterium]
MAPARTRVVLALVGAALFLSASPSRGQEAAFDQRHLWDVHPRVRVAPERPQELRHEELYDILRQLARSSPELQVEEVGRSVEGRALYLVRAGRGRQRVLLWSQMHGDEPTATGALLDLLSYLSRQRKEPFVARILEGVTILAMPMLNPDGAMRRQRRNALGIDINRDARDLQTPEGQ